jgi:hypothetical protein
MCSLMDVVARMSSVALQTHILCNVAHLRQSSFYNEISHTTVRSDCLFRA